MTFVFASSRLYFRTSVYISLRRVFHAGCTVRCFLCLKCFLKLRMITPICYYFVAHNKLNQADRKHRTPILGLQEWNCLDKKVWKKLRRTVTKYSVPLQWSSCWIDVCKVVIIFMHSIWQFLSHFEPTFEIIGWKCENDTSRIGITECVVTQLCSPLGHRNFLSLCKWPSVPFLIFNHYKFSYWFYVL